MASYPNLDRLRYIAYFDRADIDGWEIRKVYCVVEFLRFKEITCVSICLSAGHGRPLRHGLGTRAPHHRLRLESLQEGQRLLSHHQVGYFGNLILFCAEPLICYWIALELVTFSSEFWRLSRSSVEPRNLRSGPTLCRCYSLAHSLNIFSSEPNLVPVGLIPCFRHLLAFHQELRPTLDELGVLLPEVKLLC